jgi:hypothetical protein
MGGKPEIRKRLEGNAAEPVPDEKVEALWEELTDFEGYYAEMSVNDHMAAMGESMKTAYEVFMARSWGSDQVRAPRAAHPRSSGDAGA